MEKVNAKAIQRSLSLPKLRTRYLSVNVADPNNRPTGMAPSPSGQKNFQRAQRLNLETGKLNNENSDQVSCFKAGLRFPFIASSKDMKEESFNRAKPSYSMNYSKEERRPLKVREGICHLNCLVDSSAFDDQHCCPSVQQRSREYVHLQSCNRSSAVKNLCDSLDVTICVEKKTHKRDKSPLRSLAKSVCSSSITRVSQFFMNAQGPLSLKTKGIIQNKIRNAQKLRL